ncbi:MAG: type I-U CRISPR-associated RAMP protein Csb1/Cas7u [Thermoplasmata archaeon]
MHKTVIKGSILRENWEAEKMTDGKEIEKYDEWLKDDSPVAALTMRQWFLPAEGRDAVIFPPTYPLDRDQSGYNIDKFEEDGTSVCQIDSVGSQANRMEPIFKREPYRALVPHVYIKAKIEGVERRIDILDAGHRAADAIVRFSELGPILHKAFRSYQNEGDARPLAQIAPTSIVFGSWDSRATQAKIPRIVRSVIRAFNVKPLRRSAQYTTIAGEILAGGEAEVEIKGPKAELGLAHVPSTGTHGGVLVQGEIRKDAILNLSALRTLGVPGQPEETMKLRRYIFGLSLVAFTAPTETFLRQGCELVQDPNKPTEWKIVNYDGIRSELKITHDEALSFAKAAAEAFGVSKEDKEATFNTEVASALLELEEDERKKLLRSGNLTIEAIKAVKATPKRGRKGKTEESPEQRE